MTLILVLSPAKTLDFTRAQIQKCSIPRFSQEPKELVQELQKLSKPQLRSLLNVSDNIAALNYQRYRDFCLKPAPKNPLPTDTSKQAVFAFCGPAYQGLDAASLSEEDLEFGQSHLRILCGLYGILRPLDLMQPYRLEMGQNFKTNAHDNLYGFWGNKIAKAINADFADQHGNGNGNGEKPKGKVKAESKGEKVLLNVASNEYFKSVDLNALSDDIRVISCVFKDDGKIKSVYAKRARGLMCRYVFQHRAECVETVKRFDLEGYKFTESESDESTLVFNRSKSAADKAVTSSRSNGQTIKSRMKKSAEIIPKTEPSQVETPEEIPRKRNPAPLLDGPRTRSRTKRQNE